MKKEFYRMFYEEWDEGVECFGSGDQALILKGAYQTLVHQMYRRQGSIPNDAQILGSYLLVTPARARTLVKMLLKHGKLVASEGRLFNGRVATELRHRSDLAAVRSRSGGLGGRPKKDQQDQQSDEENEKQMLSNENQMLSNDSSLIFSTLLSSESVESQLHSGSSNYIHESVPVSNRDGGGE